MIAAARPYDVVKRAMDICLGGTLLLVSLPVQLVVALVVRKDLGRPILFRQERPGRDGEIFELVKFRTMRIATSGTPTASDGDRLTGCGRVLRATSLDELPTLFNVLAGDMSLVGPRPLLTAYLDRYTPEQHRRHEVKPGITGLAQVSGRNRLTWEEKFELDLLYARTRSLRVDLMVLARTFATVLTGRGVTMTGEPTTKEFEGPHGRP